MPERARHVVCLHGFLSSPKARKCVWIAQAASRLPGVACHVPDINDSPEAVARRLRALVEGLDGTVAMAGASLGGFYAAWLAAQLAKAGRSARLLMINPATRPWEYVERFEGTMVRQGGKSAFIEPGFAEALRDMAREFPWLGRCAVPGLLFTAQGDEVLDPSVAPLDFPGLPHWSVPGSDHAVSDLGSYGPAWLAFLAEGRLPPAVAQD